MQTVDDIAEVAGTIGYEVLTSLGARYARRYAANGASSLSTTPTSKTLSSGDSAGRTW